MVLLFGYGDGWGHEVDDEPSSAREQWVLECLVGPLNLCAGLGVKSIGWIRDRCSTAHFVGGR